MNIRNPLFSYLLCAAMFVLGCVAMTSNFAAQLDDAETNIRLGRTILLDEKLQADTLSKMLTERGYVETGADARLISEWITGRINALGAPENLGVLNRPAYKMQAERALTEGGLELRKRVEQDFASLGMDSEWHKAKSEKLSPDFGNGPSCITVKIRNAKEIPNAPLGEITVRLREHSIDSINATGGKVQGKKPEQITRTVGYAVTDANGEARFHVQAGKSYSAVPISRGYQYGREKGTTATGELSQNGLTLNFRQQEHVISPFDSYTYQSLKSDRALAVRTPAQYKDSLVAGAVIYLVGWFLFFLFMIARDRMKRTRTDYLPAVLIMVLTGIGILSMYAMTSPLTDKNYGMAMSVALAMGLVAMGLVSCVNPAKFFAGKSQLLGMTVPFDPLDRIVRKHRKKSLDTTSHFSLSSGFAYLLTAVGLIILLGMFGTGPEGSDARVNLGGFQPSEICKYLIMIFVAAFFAENSLLLQAFSAKLTPMSARRQLGTVSAVVIVMLGLMMLYLLVLSDMGPSLVILVTFIFLYSMARRDFAQLLVGLLSFIAVMLCARAINNTTLTLCLAALLWFAAWIAYGWFRSRQIYESALILNLLIVVFALGGPILQLLGAETEADRLNNRTAMAWGGQWDNHVLGGDQVAQGIWSAASGGATGMGLGNGTPSVVPAFHTDMVFTSIGEMLGLTGMLLVIVCFVLLIHRSLLIGRRAGQPFTMYLVMGIALLTGVQFLFIVFGSLGIVPLSGVTVPFLSYSRTSLIVTMASLGIVIAASRVRATESQLKYARSFSGAIAASVIMFMLGAVVIVWALADYQIVHRNETLIRPAYITNTAGARIIEYNPRIGMVLNRLHAGNIYDTNGVLLATSSPDSLRNAIPAMTKLGINSADLRKEAHRRKSRYYTMGNQMLFMLGDAGSKKVLGYQDSDPIGFMAESRYAGELRGIDIPSRSVSLHSDKYRANRFMPPTGETFTPRERDYSKIIPFLNHGLYNNPLIEAFNANRASRDLYLTVDARLQKRLQDDLDRYMSANFRSLDRLRASVVVVNATTGDLLTSANYPLPQQDSIVMLNERGLYGDAPFERIKGHRPITERDLGMTFQTPPGSTAKVLSAMAALRGLGTEATRQSYYVTATRGIEGANEPQGNVTMACAIPESSNNFFINIINDRNLYGPLGDVYEAVGVRLHDNDPKNPNANTPTYFFNIGELGNSDLFRSNLSAISARALRLYSRIAAPDRVEKTTNKDWGKFELHPAWGQEPLKATPLSMARAAAIVANEGKLAPTRYVRQMGHTKMPYEKQIEIMGSTEAGLLKKFMQAESEKGIMPVHPGDPKSIGGKTGTPERSDRRGNAHVNDAWYICFMYSDKLRAPIAVAIRMERTPNLTSRVAKTAMAQCVIPSLNAAGYQIY